MGDIFLAHGIPNRIAALRAEALTLLEQLNSLETNPGQEFLFGFSAGSTPWRSGPVVSDRYRGAWIGHPEEISSTNGVEFVDSPGSNSSLKIAPGRLNGLILNSIRGPFGLVVWDREEDRMHLVRDKLGLIPLRFSLSTDRRLIAVSSRGELLRRLSGPRSPCHSRVQDLLHGRLDNGRDDFLKNEFRVFPREHLKLRPCGDWSADRYWHPETAPIEARPALRKLCRDSVESAVERLDPHRQILALSGGVDSSLLAGLFAQKSERLQDFPAASMVCRESRLFDERRSIVETARVLPIEVHLFDVSNLWPLKEKECYTEELGDGPNCYALEYSETRFQQWVHDLLAAGGIVFGTGAEFAFDVLSHGTARQALLNRMNFAELWRKSRGSTLSRISSVLRSSAKYVVEGTWAEQPARWANRNLFQQEPEPSPKWLTGSPNQDSHKTRRSWENQGEAKLNFLDQWSHEIAVRGWARAQRRTGIRHHYPYLDEEVVEVALRIPAHLTLNKTLLRGMAKDIIGRDADFSDSSQTMSPLVAKSIGSTETGFISNLFRNSNLGQKNYIDESLLVKAIQDFASTVREHGVDSSKPEYRMWLAIASEIWLRAL